MPKKKRARFVRSETVVEAAGGWMFAIFVVDETEDRLIRFAYHSPSAYASKSSAERGMNRWIATMREAFS